MKLSRKIFISFMMLLFMILFLGSAGIYYLQNNNKNITNSLKTQQVVLAYNDISFQTVRANAAIRGYMLYEESFMIENHYEIRDTLHEQIDKLQHIGGIDENQFNEYLSMLTDWENAIDDEIIPLIESGHSEKAKSISKPILGEGSQNLVMFARE